MSQLLMLGKSNISNANKVRDEDLDAHMLNIDWPEDSGKKAKIIRTRAQSMTGNVEEVCNSFITVLRRKACDLRRKACDDGAEACDLQSNYKGLRPPATIGRLGKVGVLLGIELYSLKVWSRSACSLNTFGIDFPTST
ncbi:hypothetical protein TEA_017959 [Camellia sinensis var. sinensis]|uniref:DUF7798 domain-containing protein n=1 Tax=Camellia sinensis var. sinensis TaxID=542762 RepID=A0A4S4EY65_CAMSN|nr:hypothetical protein TEA_017959 [Camellia sinensis var. sinensis]